ncbi:hypothetical protein BaRGS_00016116 [Batillaria attramentaria]|uniref:Uncharacterized protein n=1 Tax=Batillaria attramentaria TaxID=370345 RepID=A0ABD0KZP3_9CAEN
MNEGNNSSTRQQQQHDIMTVNATDTPLSSVEDPSGQVSPSRLRLIDIAQGPGVTPVSTGEKVPGGDGDDGASPLLKVVTTSADSSPSPDFPSEERVV